MNQTNRLASNDPNIYTNNFITQNQWNREPPSYDELNLRNQSQTIDLNATQSLGQPLPVLPGSVGPNNKHGYITSGANTQF
jgi:hypothetical protein